jgi:signal transduction histidine kinase
MTAAAPTDPLVAPMRVGPDLDVSNDGCFEQVRSQLAVDAVLVLRWAQDALQGAEDQGLAAEAVRALLVCGMAYDALGQVERDSVFAEALQRAEALADPVLLVRAANSQIVADIYHGRYADALARGQHLLGVAYALQRDDLLGQLLHNLGAALTLIGEFALAISMFNERVTLLAETGTLSHQQRLRAINNIATAWFGLARAQGDVEGGAIARQALYRARTLAEQACEGSLTEAHGALRAGSLDTLVGVLLESGDADSAMSWVTRVGAASADLFTPGSVPWGTYALALSRAELAQTGPDLAATLARLREIEALPGPRFRGGEMQATLNKCLADTLAQLGRSREALAYHRRWLQFEAQTQSLLAREHAMAVHHTLDSLRGETEEFITHDLRNPLGAALVQMESVHLDGLAPSARAGLSRARKSVQQAFDTAERYLTVVRTRNLRRSDLKTIDLAELVDDVGERLAPPAHAPVRLEREIDWGLLVRGDRITLLMALHQLLRNALRHAPARTTVEWKLTVDGREAVLSVANGGPGLTEPGRRQLLSQGAAAEVRRGSGLAMIARVAHLHDAQIGIDDQPTRVTLRFPLAEPEGPGGT